MNGTRGAIRPDATSRDRRSSVDITYDATLRCTGLSKGCGELRVTRPIETTLYCQYARVSPVVTCEWTSEAPATFASSQERATKTETLEPCARAVRLQWAPRQLSSSQQPALERDSGSYGSPHQHACAAPSLSHRVLTLPSAPSLRASSTPPAPSSSFSFGPSSSKHLYECQQACSAVGSAHLLRNSC